MAPRPFPVLARAPGDIRACESRTTKRSPPLGRSPQPGSVPSYARSERFLWYRLRLTVSEMNYAVRRMTELQMCLA
jgi:hypothetical protein